MTHLLELVSRPQFASLKTLIPSHKIQMSANALQKIAKACPLLEYFDAGLSLCSMMKLDDKKLAMLPYLFPRLKGLRFNTRMMTDRGIQSFCEIMGERLELIRVREYTRDRKISDQTLEIMGRHCPNLKHFEYNYVMYDHSREQNKITERGVIGLMDSCRKIQHLSLIAPYALGKAVFQHIAEPGNRHSLRRLYIVDHQELLEDEALCAALQKNIDEVEVIPRQVHHTQRTQYAA